MTNRFFFCRTYSEPLLYCLQDKKVRQEQTLRPERVEGKEVRVKNRAQVLYYHRCCGGEQELMRQFREVQKLNYNVSKPAFHLSLNFPPEEKVTNSELVDIARDCAKVLDFEQHQYVVIRHKDTEHPHIHIVVNRVAADEHTMEDYQILKNVTRFCRDAEQKYQLTPLQTIRRYRSPEERWELSKSPRMVQLREAIGQTLGRVDNLDSFVEQMGERGYRVYKYEKGIAYKDQDGVYTQGYKVNYSLKKVEVELSRQRELTQRLRQEEELVQRRGLRLRM